jgi:hypothetical protein
MLQLASLYQLASTMTDSVLVWLPETYRIGVIKSSSLVNELRHFCSNPAYLTTDLIKETDFHLLYPLSRFTAKSRLSPLDVRWSTNPFSKSLYSLIVKKDYLKQCEPYALRYLHEQDTISYSRQHEISTLVGAQGILDISLLNKPFPGKRPHLLIKGTFPKSSL